MPRQLLPGCRGLHCTSDHSPPARPTWRIGVAPPPAPLGVLSVQGVGGRREAQPEATAACGMRSHRSCLRGPIGVAGPEPPLCPECCPRVIGQTLNPRGLGSRGPGWPADPSPLSLPASLFLPLQTSPGGLVPSGCSRRHSPFRCQSPEGSIGCAWLGTRRLPPVHDVVARAGSRRHSPPCAPSPFCPCPAQRCHPALASP